MPPTKLAASLTLLLLVACQTDGGDAAADEAEASSGSDASTSDASSTEAGSSSTDASSTDASSTDASSTDASSSSTESDSETSSSSSSTTLGESTSDTGFESCEMIEMLYDELVSSPLNAACSEDAECHVVEGHCWMGLGGCWYVVNQNLQQTDLEQLANGFSGLGCFGPICLCIEVPDSVGCVDGTCVAL